MYQLCWEKAAATPSGITKYLLFNQIKYPNTDINTVITIRYDVR